MTEQQKLHKYMYNRFLYWFEHEREHAQNNARQAKPSYRERRRKYMSAFYERNKKEIERKREEAHRRNPEKESARRRLRYAIAVGKITRLPCEVCGNPKSHGHHHDYFKPYDVKWLCSLHHGIEERTYKK